MPAQANQPQGTIFSCDNRHSGTASRRRNGAPLTRDDSKASYAVIRHNILTYESGGVVEVTRGRENADRALKALAEGQSSGDRQEGWRYFCEKTSLKVGMDPGQATQLRQAALELRESAADPNPGANPTFSPSKNS